MPLRQAIHATLKKGNRYYVALCLDLPVVTQGETADEAMSNLEEAIAFHLLGEDLEALGLAAQHELQVDMEAGDDA